MPKEHVALTKCFYCMQGDRILLARRYNQKGEPVHDLAPYNGMVVDMDPCRECADYMKKGIILIGIDEEKSDPNWNVPPMPPNKNWIPNPWRSGAFVVLTEEAFERIFQGEAAKFGPKHRWTFVEHEVLKRIGAIDDE